MIAIEHGVDRERIPPRAAASNRLAGLTPVIGVLIVIVLALIVLSPVLQSGYSGDDTWNSQTAYILADRNLSLRDYWLGILSGWMTNVGRFFPLALVQAFGAFLLFPERLLYKIYLVAMTIGNLLLLMALVRAIAREWPIAFLAGIIAVATLQVRAWEDPLVAYAGLQQAVVAAVLGATLCIIAFLRAGRWSWATAAVLLWTAGLLSYEVTYLLVLVPGIVCIAVPAPRRRYIQAAAAILVPSLVIGLFTVWLRLNAVAPGPYATNLSPERFLPALWFQVTGAIPLSFALLQQGGLPTGQADGLTALTVVVLTVACVVAAVRGWREVSKRALAALAGVGVVLWIIPALVIAQAERYQSVLQPGLAHIPVYIEYLGLALVATVILATLVQLFDGQSARLVLALVVGLGLAVLMHWTAVANRAVVAELNVTRRWTRDLLEQSIHQGIFAGVPAGAVVFAQQPYPETNACFIQGVGAPRVEVLTPPEWVNVMCTRSIDDPDAPEPRYYLNVVSAADGSHGQVVLARIAALIPIEQRYSASTSDFLMYIQGQQPNVEDDMRIACAWTPRPRRPGDTMRTMGGSEISRVAAGDDWSLLHVQLATGACAAESITEPS